MAGNNWNFWKLLEMAGNGWNGPELEDSEIVKKIKIHEFSRI